MKLNRSLGRFIVFDGVEGVGKSTQVKALEQWLHGQKIPCLVTREPGGTPLGEDIRSLVLSIRGKDKVCPEAELLLMMAARMQHWVYKIQPLLESGTWVICDRFIDSSVAYQGAGRGLSESMIRDFHQALSPAMQADLIVILDMPLKDSLNRVKSRGDASDRIEQSSHGFFTKARQCFLNSAALAPDRYCIIDGALKPHQISSKVAGECQQRFSI